MEINFGRIHPPLSTHPGCIIRGHLVHNRVEPCVGTLADETLERKGTPGRCSRISPLVLDRKAGVAGTASEFPLCDCFGYRNYYPYLYYVEITVERGI